MRQSSNEIFEDKTVIFESELISLAENSHDFIPISDTSGNLLIYNNVCGRMAFLRQVWIRYQANGGNIGYLNLN